MFLWGVSTSSHQTEGGNTSNDWWKWEQSGAVRRGESSGLACDFRNLYREDIRRIAELGCNSFRFSIEWSRLEPKQGEWQGSELEWYSEIVDLCLEQGIEPMVTLFHFTTPQWFADKGGFTRTENIEYFGRYVERVLEALKDRVNFWCTLNEPMVYAGGAYLGRFMPPAVWSPENFVLCNQNLLRAHVLAYDLIKRVAGLRAKVGLAHNLLSFQPQRWWSPLDRLVTSAVERIYNREWLQALVGKPVRFHLFPLLPKLPYVEEARGRITADFIGVNFYTKAIIGVGGAPSRSYLGLVPRPFQVSFSEDTDQQSDLGWAICPEAFERTLVEVSKYRLPVIVTENGIASENDRLRQHYLISHLSALESAKARGVNILGYFHWSLLDNFEWSEGFQPRFGLYRVNYKTQERSPRESCNLYRDWIRKHPQP